MPRDPDRLELVWVGGVNNFGWFERPDNFPREIYAEMHTPTVGAYLGFGLGAREVGFYSGIGYRWGSGA